MNKNENAFTQARVILKNGRIKFGIILSKLTELEAGKDMMFAENISGSQLEYKVKDIETILNSHIRGVDLLLK